MNKSLTWGNKTEIPSLSVDLPYKIDQVPDLFIYLYSETTFKYKEKLGFVRIEAKSLFNKEAKPDWKTLVSIESAKRDVGELHMNAQLV